MKSHADLAASLAGATRYRFSDFPAPDLPRVAAGVYAVFDSDEAFLYVGMAGAALDADAIRSKIEAGKKSGLADRLGYHASGQRSGDRFNIYIADLYVLPRLTAEEIADIADRKIAFDNLVRDYIRENLSYQFIELPNTEVRDFERFVQRKGLDGTKPWINPLG